MAGPVYLVMDLRVVHDRVGSSADPPLNGHLGFPNNLDQSLNDTTVDKVRCVFICIRIRSKDENRG